MDTSGTWLDSQKCFRKTPAGGGAPHTKKPLLVLARCEIYQQAGRRAKNGTPVRVRNTHSFDISGAICPLSSGRRQDPSHFLQSVIKAFQDSPRLRNHGGPTGWGGTPPRGREEAHRLRGLGRLGRGSSAPFFTAEAADSVLTVGLASRPRIPSHGGRSARSFITHVGKPPSLALSHRSTKSRAGM